jgi:class 3 adenylate cyclase
MVYRPSDLSPDRAILGVGEVPDIGRQCAVEVQDAIAKENADCPAGEQMRFRIGVHVGDILVQGDNLFGDAVNAAARLEALAEPGGICVSGTVRDHIGTKLPLTFAGLISRGWRSR